MYCIPETAHLHSDQKVMLNNQAVLYLARMAEMCDETFGKVTAVCSKQHQYGAET